MILVAQKLCLTSNLICMWLPFRWILQLLHFQVCPSPSFPLISPQKLPWDFPQGCQSQLHPFLGTCLAPPCRDKTSYWMLLKCCSSCAPLRAGKVRRVISLAGCSVLLQSSDFWENRGSRTCSSFRIHSRSSSLGAFSDRSSWQEGQLTPVQI